MDEIDQKRKAAFLTPMLESVKNTKQEFNQQLNAHRMLPRAQQKRQAVVNQSSLFLNSKTQGQGRGSLTADELDLEESKNNEAGSSTMLKSSKKARQDSEPIASKASFSLGASNKSISAAIAKSVSSSSNDEKEEDSEEEDDIVVDGEAMPTDHLRMKYLLEAPLSFKVNPPPKIVDLTSDFFEKDTD